MKYFSRQFGVKMKSFSYSKIETKANLPHRYRRAEYYVPKVFALEIIQCIVVSYGFGLV